MERKRSPTMIFCMLKVTVISLPTWSALLGRRECRTQFGKPRATRQGRPVGAYPLRKKMLLNRTIRTANKQLSEAVTDIEDGAL